MAAEYPILKFEFEILDREGSIHIYKTKAYKISNNKIVLFAIEVGLNGDSDTFSVYGQRENIYELEVKLFVEIFDYLKTRREEKSVIESMNKPEKLFRREN